MSTELHDLAARYGAAWAEHDLEAVLDLHTDDTVFHLHGDRQPVIGRAGAREAFSELLAATPDLRFERLRMHFGADSWIVEYEMTGTTAGSRFACDGIDVVTTRDGLVARKDTYLDWIVLGQQVDLAAEAEQTAPAS